MIAIVDYNAGNLTSVRLAFDALQVPAEITRDPARIAAAERVVFPGVGHAGAAMRNLHALGLVAAVRAAIASGRPFLGICLGMQILLESSEESETDRDTPCIGLIGGRVVRFRPSDRRQKVPQMGWNAVTQRQDHPIFAAIPDGSEFYFVHSYYAQASRPAEVLGSTDYGDVDFASVVGRDNVVATQFHPERSGRVGLQLLQNFATWQI